MGLSAKIKWQKKLAFAAELNGHRFIVDTDRESGGEDRGPRPKGLVLVALAGCTGMDVISILEKMRVRVADFTVETEAVVAKEHPMKILEILVKYEFHGDSLPYDKIKKAIELSETKYCGVRATLVPGVKIQREIYLNDQKIEQ